MKPENQNDIDNQNVEKEIINPGSNENPQPEIDPEKKDIPEEQYENPEDDQQKKND